MTIRERMGSSSGGGTEKEMVDHPVVVHENEPSPSSMIFKRATRPVTLKFEDVVYKLTPKREGILKKTSVEEKIILKGVSGMVLPGELLAMLGPSGSGKTTLLTALGGRLGGGRLEGSITYNNNPFSNTVKRNTGFVTQDDILYPTLTVDETLAYTALLRLPNSLTKQDKISYADAVIAQLGLNRCRTSLIGGPSLRGISGGQRKRVSIGQEMLIDPGLLFLDEPTSGLDSTTAQQIVLTLWELANNGGRTVVMTIHQPSSRLFYLFHKVLLLSEGNAIYFGNGADAIDYFASIGYAPSVPMNPSDFLLDLANGIASDNSQEDPTVTKSALVSAFNANIAVSTKAALHENNMPTELQVVEGERSGRWMTTWWQQFSVLLSRGLRARKSESISGLRIGEVLAIAILAGLLWWQTDISHLQDQLGLLFFYTVFWGFHPLLQALFTFPDERMMLEKERSSGIYRLSSYFVSRILVDLPIELALPTVFVTITYFMAGLKPTAGHFLKSLFSLLLGALVSQGLGLALGALVMDTKAATTLASVIMLTFLIAGGFYVQHVPAFIGWIKYMSISNYTYKLLLGSQYKPDDTYPCGHDDLSTCLVGDFPSIRMMGLGGQVISVVALVIMVVAYQLIAYWALTRIGVTKPRF